jgi:hypothetical protein
MPPSWHNRAEFFQDGVLLWLQDPATLWRLHRYVQAVLSPRTTKTVTPRTPSGKRAASSPAHKSPSKRSKRVVSPP